MGQKKATHLSSLMKNSSIHRKSRNQEKAERRQTSDRFVSDVVISLFCFNVIPAQSFTARTN
jgi:hypothetical protein